MHIERELKFRLSERAAARAWSVLPDVTAQRVRQVQSVYFDTPDLRLLETGAALRLRKDGRRWLQTLKLDKQAASALTERLEWEHTLARGRLAIEHLTHENIESKLGLRPAMLLRALQPMFATQFKRRSAQMRLADATRIEVSLDRGFIRAGKRREPLLELELELLHGQPATLLASAAQWIEPLGLQLEFRSKAQRGYRLARKATEAPVKGSGPNFDSKATVEQAFLDVLGRSLFQAGANLHGVVASRNPEYLHQLRVGLRRARTALRAFRGMARKALTAPLQSEFDRLAPALGAARDWDVLAETLNRAARDAVKAGPSFAPLARIVAARRGHARREARACVASAAFQLLVLHAMAWMERKPWRGTGARGSVADRSLSAFAPRVLERLEQKAVRAGKRIDWSDATARHALRVRIRRLRYACEFFAPCLARRSVRRYLQRLEALQDLLGELNDFAVARRLLAPFETGPGASAAAFAQGWLAARERALLSSLPGTWQTLRRGKRCW